MSNGNGGRPPWAENVTEADDGSVSVGPEPREEARQRAENAATQLDRLEAKIDYLISIMEDA